MYMYLLRLKTSNASLYELLQIFTTGDYITFKAFAAKHTNMFNDVLTVDACAQKMRILTLISLATDKVYIYVYINVCVCIHVYTYVRVCIYVYAYVCVTSYFSFNSITYIL